MDNMNSSHTHKPAPARRPAAQLQFQRRLAPAPLRSRLRKAELPPELHILDIAWSYLDSYQLLLPRTGHETRSSPKSCDLQHAENELVVASSQTLVRKILRCSFLPLAAPIDLAIPRG